MVIFLFVILLSSTSAATAPTFESMIHWSKDGMFDFCPEKKNFDYRNAYWLAALSYYSYWAPTYLEQIFTTPIGTAFKLKVPSENGSGEEELETYGLGWKGHVDFFTSSVLLPHSPKSYNDHYKSYFAAPLPLEACVKKEMQWCFGFKDNRYLGKREKEACGSNSRNAFLSRERLHNVYELSLGGDRLSDNDRLQAIKDKKVIQYYVNAYEKKKNIPLGLDFLDPELEDRCEIYKTGDQFTPDVQAIWVESPELIVVAVRGTEPNNIIDWATDFATSFQLDQNYLPFWKRNIHKGYEQSLEVMNSWLQAQVDQLFKRYPNASSIPIFLTGHSMGGALATLIMTSWLERNQKVSKDTRLNLKAVYTYGAPRIGNDSFAKYFSDVNSTENVGIYRIVNKRDFVARVPCFEYAHFGSYIQLINSSTTVPSPSPIDVLINPSSYDYKYCAYGDSFFDSVSRFQEYANNHSLTSYFNSLSVSRIQLQTALRKEARRRKDQASSSAESESNPFQYPSNCDSKIHPKDLQPKYLQYNFQKIPFEIEGEY